MSHRYVLGQLVHAAARFADRTDGVYEIIRLMPESGGEFGYRIKHTASGAQRAVGESELRAVDAEHGAAALTQDDR